MKSRNTIQKVLVQQALHLLPAHPTPDALYDEIHKNHPHVSRSTVYRHLNLMAEQNEVLRIGIPNAADRIDCRIEEHYHIVCKKCGLVVDAEMPTLLHLEQQISDLHGFSIEAHNIVFTGFCPTCK